MDRTIRVRGQANVKVRPDYVYVCMNCETLDMDYENAMHTAAQTVERLKDALEKVGIGFDCLVTTGFNVDTAYESQEYNGPKKFVGYRVRQNLRVGVDFDKERLGVILGAIAQSEAVPEFNVRFTVKDMHAVKEELFAQCAANARTIAKGLCAGAGCELGEILSVDYSWDEIDVRGLAFEGGAMPQKTGFHLHDINPEEIDVSDSVMFVWKLEGGKDVCQG